jgi:preprotein translocase subunit SecA
LVRRPGKVTIATDMAGRGTDVVLGGSPVVLALTELERYLLPGLTFGVSVVLFCCVVLLCCFVLLFGLHLTMEPQLKRLNLFEPRWLQTHDTI